MAVASSTGAEVPRPLATVVIGGLVTATALTLSVLPATAKLVLDPGWTDRRLRQQWSPDERQCRLETRTSTLER